MFFNSGEKISEKGKKPKTENFIYPLTRGVKWKKRSALERFDKVYFVSNFSFGFMNFPFSFIEK